MAKFFRTPFAAVGDREEIPDETQGTGAVSYPEGFGFDYERDPATDPAAKRVPRKQTNQYLYDITDNLRQYQLFGTPEWVPASENGGEPVAYAANARVLFDGKLYRALQTTTAQPGVGGTWREEEPFNLAALRASTAQAQAGTDNATLMTPLRVKEAIAAQTTTLTPAQILAALLTVDGPGSGLDADLLDGLHASAFARLTGATFSGDIGVARGFYFRGYTSSNANTRLLGMNPSTNILYFGGIDQPIDDIYFVNNGAVSARLTGAGASATLRVANHLVWNAGNDGAGSGLDADLLDGLQGAQFMRSDVTAATAGIYNPTLAGDLNSVERQSYRSVIPFNSGYQAANRPVGNYISGLDFGSYLENYGWQIAAAFPAANRFFARHRHAGIWQSWVEFWHTGNDGSGSGLDADLLDGLQGSAYAQLTGAVFTGSVSVAGTLSISGQGIQRSGTPAGTFFGVEVNGNWMMRSGGGYFQILNAVDNAPFFTASATAGATVLGAKVWTAGNDGSGSGLDADLLDGLQGSAYAKTADFSQSLTLSGYCKLPNGVIMQWGRFTAAVDTTTSVNFPTVFPNFCGGVTVSGTYNWSGSAEDNAPNVKSGTVLPNKFEVWNAENSSVTVYYVALGY